MSKNQMQATSFFEKTVNFFIGRGSDEKRLDVEDRQVPYLEIGVADQPKQPLLIGVHGFGANETQMKTLVNIELDQPVTYIAPRGSYAHPTGGYAWFPIEVQDGHILLDPKRLEVCIDELDAFIEAAVERYDADPQRVVFVGYSQGGALAFAYLLRHPERIVASVATAGSLLLDALPWADESKMAEKHLFIGYGTLDPFVTRDEMETAATFFNSLGVNTTLKSYRIPHVVSQTEVSDIEAFLKGILKSTTH
ncbi:MAG: alpha/beta fold hydrolase [Chloroflexota bacterium]